jgi:hypothetical protein
MGLIKSNTADTITITLGFSKYPIINTVAISTPAAGTVFDIIESSSIIQLASASNVVDCLLVSMCNAYVSIEQLNVGVSGQSRAVNYSLTQQGDVRYCKFPVSASSAQVQMFQCQRTFVTGCYSSVGKFYFAQRTGNNTSVNGCIAVGSGSGQGIRYNVSPGQVSVTDNVLDEFELAIFIENSGQLFVDRNVINSTVSYSAGIAVARCVYVNSSASNTGTATGTGSVGQTFVAPCFGSLASSSTITGVAGDIAIDGDVVTYASLVSEGSIVGKNGARLLAI